MKIELRIPARNFPIFRETIKSRWFNADEPELSRHRLMANERFEYASFDTNCDGDGAEEDIRFVINIALSLGGAVLSDKDGNVALS